MDMKDLRKVERIMMGLALADMLLFAAGYFLGILFFYTFLACSCILLSVWLLYWKCPHCGRKLWWNFDLPCKHCQEDIYQKPLSKPKNVEERTGFFHW